MTQEEQAIYDQIVAALGLPTEALLLDILLAIVERLP